jgi:hypothetical protein
MEKCGGYMKEYISEYRFEKAEELLGALGALKLSLSSVANFNTG